MLVLPDPTETAPIYVQTKPMHPGRRRWLEDRTEAAISRTPRLYHLNRRLLALGGEAGRFSPGTPIPWLEELLEWGEVFPGASRLKRGRRGRCHTNSALLWAAAKETRRIVTGYALSTDGCWWQHSWVLEQAEGKPPVIETTTRRLLYYGVILTYEEAEWFLWAETGGM